MTPLAPSITLRPNDWQNSPGFLGWFPPAFKSGSGVICGTCGQRKPKPKAAS